MLAHLLGGLLFVFHSGKLYLCSMATNKIELSVDFVEQTKALFGEERYSQFYSALEMEPVVSVRHNPAKRAAEFCGEQVAWAADACYLDSRPLFTADPLFHAGCYYVQEASSMFLEQVFKQYVDAPVRMLDLCAAPGGKSIHTSLMMKNQGILLSNEISKLFIYVSLVTATKLGFST